MIHHCLLRLGRYLELHDWDVHKSINAAKSDIEWEKSQSDSLEESKSPIEPPSTSYYRYINSNNINVNVRVEQKENQRDDHHQSSDINACNLLELKEVKDAAERWEELSCPNSYHSCIDNSMPWPKHDRGHAVFVDSYNQVSISLELCGFEMLPHY